MELVADAEAMKGSDTEKGMDPPVDGLDETGFSDKDVELDEPVAVPDGAPVTGHSDCIFGQ